MVFRLAQPIATIRRTLNPNPIAAESRASANLSGQE